MKMNLIEAENAIVEEFSMYEEWLDKYEYLIELGKSLKDYPEEAKTDDKLIKGCQSRVWLDHKVEDGKIIFNADSDAIITKGIIALLIRVMNGRKPQEIVDMDLYFIDAIGLGENLSPTRSNGLVAMIKQMKMYALALTSKA
jgi:cysteine desulfuration protein SufE